MSAKSTVNNDGIPQTTLHNVCHNYYNSGMDRVITSLINVTWSITAILNDMQLNISMTKEGISVFLSVCIYMYER